MPMSLEATHSRKILAQFVKTPVINIDAEKARE